MAHGKATILISHDLSLAPMADHILMLDHGRLVEQGRHEDLLRTGGPYARLHSPHRLEPGPGDPAPKLSSRPLVETATLEVAVPSLGRASTRRWAAPTRLRGNDSRQLMEPVGSGRWQIRGDLVGSEPDPRSH